uniref:Uncharacterized protein n=1 Tax=Kwoniella bestiolae CBS 10118 TaxID=1296100 RepID=A0A1B9FXF1_9TREE|nr:hypothetical protein I302_06431 [Kwoniella bestiolae CBS 10118]OCF23449.1 hypothetical protein I302_06431 [Kwoniella bestiolae CBS 10118]
MPAPVMSQLENTSAILGEYMLKGWTLTDLHCSDCRVTPLMREPSGSAEREARERIQFCALCDGRPEGRMSTSQPQPQPGSNTNLRPDEVEERKGPNQSQSDEAALSISDLLLRGYSLLGNNCPNTQCKGIPLVGYPRKVDGSKDSRKMCVSCGSRWIDENEVHSQGMKVVPPQQEEQIESPRTKARNQLYGLDGGKGKQKREEKDVEEFERRAKESARRLASESESQNGAGANVEDVDMEDEVQSTGPIRPSPMPRPHNQPTPPSPSSPLGKALSSTSNSLSSTLQNLSQSLERYTSQGPSQRRIGGEEESGKWFVDLKLHTEAIKDVLGVLGQVERAKRVGY